jgi:hypothetical protein
MRINGLVVETLLKLLFEKVDIVDIQRAYIEGNEKSVVELIRKSLEGRDVVKAAGGRIEVKEEELKKEKRKGENGEAKGELDMESFW